MGAWIVAEASALGFWARTGGDLARQSPEAAVMLTLAASVTLFLVVIAAGAVRRI